MRKNISLLLGELESKASGYVALLNFRFFNLCVKAEPAALLPITIKMLGKEYDLEQVADAAKPNDFQFVIFPKDDSFRLDISKGIAKMHPEFEQKFMKVDENGKLVELSEESETNKSTKCIRLTMPKVNKDRRDLLTEGVKGLYEQCKLKLDSNFTFYGQQVVAKLFGAQKEEIDEAKEALEDIKTQHYDLAKTYRDNKLEEIETAFQEYLSEQTSKEQKDKEQYDASNKDVTQGFKMVDD